MMLSFVRPNRAVGLLAAFALAAIVIGASIVLWDLRNREIEHARIETVSLTEMLLDQTEQLFGNADLILQGVVEKLQTTYGKQFALDSLPVHLLLGARVSGLSQIRSLFIVDSFGNVINSSQQHPMANVTARDRAYFQVFNTDKSIELFIGKPVIGRADNAWTVHLARRLSGPKHEFRGVVVISLNLDYFERVYDFAKLDFVRPINLYHDDGTLIASLPHRQDELGKKAAELANTPFPEPGAGVQLLTRHMSNKNETFSLAHAEGLPLLVSVTNDEEDALASWRETAAPIAVGAGLVGVIIVIVALLLIREMKREEALAQALRAADDRYLSTVETTNEQLRKLSAALQQVREEERTYISRELHDELGQQLTGLKLDLAWLGARVREGRLTDPERFNDMRKLLDNAIASVRRISSDLRPPVLDDIGFGEAVRWLAQETAKRRNIVFEVDLPGAPQVTNAVLATALFRVVQEALTNIVRHADASKVVIRLTVQQGKFVLTISDNGKGIGLESGPAGIGLISMRERVAALGGEFSIIGSPGEGLTIEAIVPCQPPETGDQGT
jgi:signal transduction histidine kinase